MLQATASIQQNLVLCTTSQSIELVNRLGDVLTKVLLFTTIVTNISGICIGALQNKRDTAKELEEDIRQNCYGSGGNMTCMRRIASKYVGRQDCKRKRESAWTPSEEKSKKLQGNKTRRHGKYVY
jgi:hypothetical protein